MANKLSRRQRLERVFLQYGAGSHVFNRITSSRFWSHVSWVLIAIGILIWAVLFWKLRE